MKSVLLSLLVLPLLTWAQHVKPVVSSDYLSLIKKDSNKHIVSDTFNSVQSSSLTAVGNYNGDKISKINIRNSKIVLKPYTAKTLLVSGNFISIAEIKNINRTPRLQNQYVQGRSQNGQLAWQGAETNELFSYGPDINTLEFDGSNYDYDENGRLVKKGNGNGRAATPYNNNIFKTGFYFSQSLNLQAKYKINYRDFLTSCIRFSNANETSTVQHNRNSKQNFSASLETVAKIAIITGTFSSLSKDASVSNRTGFINRVYQNSLLTPISFGNRQGSILGPGQRSYSYYADNPFFLLQNNSKNFHQNQNTAALTIERKESPIRFCVVQSFEYLNQNEIAGYRPGTAFFGSGIDNNRIQRDRNYCLQANTQQNIQYDNYFFSSVATINYILSSNKSTMEYHPGKNYNYQRTCHDVITSFATKYQQKNTDAYAKLENKFYASNTTGKINFFLPAVAAFVRFNNIMDYSLSAKLVGNLNHFNSELPVNQSFSQTSLIQYNTQDVFQFFPLAEVESFKHLRPIRHTESSLKAELNYRNKLVFNAELFQRRVFEDVFPISAGSLFLLKNLASYKNKGIELELSWNTYNTKVSYNNSLSFFKYKSMVTTVEAGYNNIPIAGFKNIRESIIEGEPLGVIVGKAYLRDDRHHLVIGEDGFPMVDPSLRIIGDPTPDFVIKSWNGLNWKLFTINLGLEWKKGGDIWNGTAEVLDYYGRSKASADWRNVTGYVFEGVTTTGHSNTKPVRFYDPSLDVTNNRWTRNGFGGVDEEYIQKADLIRITNISLSYRIKSRLFNQGLLLSAYGNNLIVWTAYKGGDPTQFVFGRMGTAGLDFFNLPSLKNFGFSTSLQF